MGGGGRGGIKIVVLLAFWFSGEPLRCFASVLRTDLESAGDGGKVTQGAIVGRFKGTTAFSPSDGDFTDHLDRI